MALGGGSANADEGGDAVSSAGDRGPTVERRVRTKVMCCCRSVAIGISLTAATAATTATTPTTASPSAASAFAIRHRATAKRKLELGKTRERKHGKSE